MPMVPHRACSRFGTGAALHYTTQRRPNEQHEASMTTSATLADIAARIDMLEIRCGRCDRTGRRRVSRLARPLGAPLVRLMASRGVQGPESRSRES